MVSTNQAKTTCYGSKNNGTAGTALEAFRKTTLGMLVVLTSAAGLAQDASASARNQEVRPSLKVEKMMFNPAQRGFVFQRDHDGSPSIITTDQVSASDQSRLETSLKSEGGRDGIQVSIRVVTPTGPVVLKTLCADVAPGGKSPCLVFAVVDETINFDQPTVIIPDAPSPAGVLRQRNLPQNSAAERQMAVMQMSVNQLDPALVAPVNKFANNPTEKNWVDMAIAFRNSIAKFVGVRTPAQTSAIEQDGYQPPHLRGR
jgi:hypothetical protein